MNKRILLFILVACVFFKAHAQSSNSYDQGKPLGWAMVDGQTTGGEGGTTVTVSTFDELKAQLKAFNSEKKIIYVSGTIEFSGLLEIRGVQNKTIYGLKGATLSNPIHSEKKDETGIFYLRDCTNIIIRNLTFKSAGAYDIDGNDNLNIQNGKYIWIDHCDFQDGVDGNLDCNNGSDYICVSWCRFRYLIAPWAGGSGGSDDHRFTNLWGGGDKNASVDEGHLRTTFANCWWDEGCKERMPRIRFGQVHILNCLYSSSISNYCVGAGYRCNAYVEKCAFTSDKAKKTPWKNYATSGSYTDYNITLTGCLGANDVQQRSGSFDYFIPSNIYTLEGYDVNLVESVVGNETTGAGATLPNPEGAGVQGVFNDKATVVTTHYYTFDGKTLNSKPANVPFIQVSTLSNGKKETKKIIPNK